MGFGNPLIYRSSASGYELVPGQRVNRLGKITTINDLGGRGPALPRQPSADRLRVLSIGDSVANGGTQINDEQTYPMLTGACLRTAGLPAEVLNVAAGGWAVQNEAAWLKAHGVFGARVVLLEVNEKDLDQAFGDASLLDRNPSFPSHRPATGLSEILFRYALPRFGLGVAADPGSTAGAFNAANVGAVMNAIGEIKSLSDAAGARMAILYWDPLMSGAAGAGRAREQLFAWANGHGVQIIRPQLNRRRDAPGLFRDGIHPNERGNAIIASAICQARVI
ncbi:MAG TPA: hypothetical protein VFF98_11080 [Novosphingobium sp.]|nr:hypothetical protein [Novosphingobium sp.]